MYIHNQLLSYIVIISIWMLDIEISLYIDNIQVKCILIKEYETVSDTICALDFTVWQIWIYDYYTFNWYRNTEFILDHDDVYKIIIYWWYPNKILFHPQYRNINKWWSETININYIHWYWNIIWMNFKVWQICIYDDNILIISI